VAAPTDGVLRAAALCLACLVPAVPAAVWVGWVFVSRAVWPQPNAAELPSSARVALLLAAVVSAVGGPLTGLVVGRWVRLPAAGVLAAGVLVGWTFLGTAAFTMAPSRAATLVHVSAPFSFWVSSDGPGAPLWVVGGSPWWYLGYTVLLCGLAACAVLLREAAGAQRRRLLAVAVALGVLAVVALALAVAPDPARVLL
jgi:hypothetical protein